ncbi:MAG: hypothetical protein ACK5S6_01940 [bacterium]|jgi:hypothetical protein
MVMLRDGFKTIITITGVSGTFEEIEVSPPELDAGGSIDQTTMRNTRWRTFIGKSLVTLGEFSVKVAYSAHMYDQMLAVLGRNRHIVVTFPSGNTLSFYAILDKFTPDTLTEGERPEATITFIPSNLTTAVPPVEFSPVLSTVTTVW